MKKKYEGDANQEFNGDAILLQKQNKNQLAATQQLKETREYFNQQAEVRPSSSKVNGSHSQQRNNVFFSQNANNQRQQESGSHSQNATPMSKKSMSVRQSQTRTSNNESHRKDRGHSASSAQRASSNQQDHSGTRQKKNTFTNFLSNTQKLPSENQEKIHSIRGHSQTH
jgi:hypothetical protein